LVGGSNPTPCTFMVRTYDVDNSTEWSFKKGKRNGILSHTYEQFLSVRAKKNLIR
jgi:hypothetical protein